MRLYRENLPEVNESTYVETYERNELGFYVKLLEYDTIGFIPLSGMVRKIKSKQFAKLGNTFFAIVTSVNEKSIDLNKIKNKNIDKKKSYDRYETALKMLKIANMIYILLKKYNDVNELDEVTLEDVMEHSVWRLYDTCEVNSDLYLKVLRDISLCFDSEFYSDKFKEWVINVFKENMFTSDTTMKLELNVQTYDVDGVNEIKRIFTKDIEFKENENIVSDTPPKYTIITTMEDIEKCTKRLNYFLKQIEDNMNTDTTTIEIIKNVNTNPYTNESTESNYKIMSYPQYNLYFINEHTIDKVKVL